MRIRRIAAVLAGAVLAVAVGLVAAGPALSAISGQGHGTTLAIRPPPPY